MRTKFLKISIIVANEIIAIFFPQTMENQIVMLIQNKEILNKNKKSHTLWVCSFSLPAVYYCPRKGVHAYRLLLKNAATPSAPSSRLLLAYCVDSGFCFYYLCVMLFTLICVVLFHCHGHRLFILLILPKVFVFSLSILFSSATISFQFFLLCYHDFYRQKTFNCCIEVKQNPSK